MNVTSSVNMKVRDLFELGLDIDVYDNVCEELAIAFCMDGMELTEAGEDRFEEVLEYPCEIKGDPKVYRWVLVDVDGYHWKDRLAKAKDFFWSAAGYCTCEEYDKWFKEK